MFINKNSIIINNVNMGQYLLDAKFSYNKLWGEDSGRNLNGDMVATLVGIFPKITLHFRKLTKNELEVLAPILDSARQTVTYYDPYKKASTTMTTYTGDYEYLNKYVVSNKEEEKNQDFSISFISVSKRR